MLRCVRDTRPVAKTAFYITPFGIKTLGDGRRFDFDSFGQGVLSRACAEIGIQLVRADQLYGQGDLIGTAWTGIQSAELVIVDFSGCAPNVAAEWAMAMLIGKRIIVITQDAEDIPSDVRGQYRHIEYHEDWQSVENLKTELVREVEASLRQPATEMILTPMAGGGTTPAPGKVIVADQEFVMVQTEDGRRVCLNNIDVDYRRVVPNMAKLFPVGTHLQGAFEVDLDGESRYTLLAGRTNPWPALETEFPPGKVFESLVERVIPKVGAFIHVGHGVNGLVPEARLANRRLTLGSTVSVAISDIDPARRRIALRLHAVIAAGEPTEPDLAVGDRVFAAVTKTAREGKGGYVLVRPDDRRQSLMLHCTAMSSELRADLENDLITRDDEIYVEVITIDVGRGRVCVKDLPMPDEQQSSAAPQAA